MRKLTFTIFYEQNNQIYGYLFNKTRVEAQEIVTQLIAETGKKFYYMDGYLEK